MKKHHYGLLIVLVIAILLLNMFGIFNIMTESSTPVRVGDEVITSSDNAPPMIRANPRLGGGQQLLDPFEPKTHLKVERVKLKKIAMDRARFSELEFTVKNPGDKTMFALVKIEIRGDHMDTTRKDVFITEYKVDNLKSGYKITKEIPINFEFTNIVKPKKVTLTLLDRHTSPKKEIYTTMYPINAETMLKDAPIVIY
jgi:hypothetical protein